MTSARAQLRQVQHSIDRLRIEVRELRERLERNGAADVRHALRRRGLIWKKELHDGCVLPVAVDAQEEFYQLLRHYSFRLFVRDVIKHRDGFTLTDLVRYCSPDSAQRYLREMVTLKLVRRAGTGFRLSADATSFGPTLEWFVATALQREYGIPSAWNVRLDGTRVGGDYDVIGFCEHTCFYIETKSSPPRNIEARQIRAFFDRLETLRPHVALFLNDTQLRMGDKIAVLFAAEVRRRLGPRARTRRIERLTGEIFALADQVFIVNSDPDLIGNLGICLAHHLRRQGFRVDGGA